MSDTPQNGGPIEPSPTESSVSPPHELPTAPPPMPGAPGVAPAASSNGFAVASLVLGIVSLVMFFTVWLPFLLGVLAIVFGTLGISRANKLGGKQKGLAIAGIVCGAVAMVLAILFIVLIVNVASDQEFQDVFSSLMPTST
jgi:hypothetical protein